MLTRVRNAFLALSLARRALIALAPIVLAGAVSFGTPQAIMGYLENFFCLIEKGELAYPEKD